MALEQEAPASRPAADEGGAASVGKWLGSHPAVIVGLAVGGSLAGVAAKVADESVARGLADAGTGVAVWLLAAALIGRLALTWRVAAARSAIFFLGLCGGYYGWAQGVLGFPSTSYLYLWLALAVTAAPLVAVAVAWASPRRGFYAGSVMAAVAGASFVDGSARQLWLQMRGVLPPAFPVRPVQGVLTIAVAVLIAGLMPKHKVTRAWALGLTLPIGWAVAWATDMAFGRVLLPLL